MRCTPGQLADAQPLARDVHHLGDMHVRDAAIDRERDEGHVDGVGVLEAADALSRFRGVEGWEPRRGLAELQNVVPVVAPPHVHVGLDCFELFALAPMPLVPLGGATLQISGVSLVICKRPDAEAVMRRPLTPCFCIEQALAEPPDHAANL